MSGKEETKYALVTGASSGIGKATAKELASRGFKVFACARRVDLMNDLVKYNIEPIALDVTDSQNVLDVKKIIEEKTGGKLDILYNNAGLSCTIPAIDADDDRVARCFEVNVFAPIRMTREFSKMLIKAKGCVAFTGSIAGVAPFPWSSIYCSTKAALHQYVAVLHLELKPFGVKVLNIVTGGVDTNITDRRPLPEYSIYYSEVGVAAVEERQNMVKKHKPMSPETYAKKVVNDMLSSSDPLNVYRGSQATYVSTCMAIFPTWMIEFVFIRHFNMIPLFTYIKSKFAKDHQE